MRYEVYLADEDFKVWDTDMKQFVHIAESLEDAHAWTAGANYGEQAIQEFQTWMDTQ